MKKAMLIVSAVFLLPLLSLATHFPQYYVLDGYGGIHSGGGAATISPKPTYFGWDIARAFAYIPVGTTLVQGDGILMLDGWGGLHQGGALATDPASGGTGYFGWDIARDIVYRIIPPRVEENYSTSYSDVTSSTYVNILSEYIHVPDDGFAMVVGSAYANAPTFTTNCDVVGRIAIGNNSSTVAAAGTERVCTIESGSVIGGSWYWAYPIVTQRIMTVTKGSYHYFYFIAKREDYECSTAFRILQPTLSIIFLDQNWRGESVPSLIPEPEKMPKGDQAIPDPRVADGKR